VSARSSYYLEVTEVDYRTDQFLTLGRAEFDSDSESIAAYHQVSEVSENLAAEREYKLDRFVDHARVDEKFISAEDVRGLLGADLTHLHDQADAAAAADDEIVK
jgi:hypothetical protein